MAEPTRAFVTGSSGFIGKHLVRRLKQAGWDVIGYDLKERQDILSKSYPTMEGADIVVHLAAEKSVPRSWEIPDRFYEVNIMGTHNILQAAMYHKVGKVILISSSAAKGPQSPYGVSKQASESVASIFSYLGMNVVCLRLFNVFGPGQPADDPYSAVVPKFITAFLNGESPVIHGDGTQSRDFTYVEDVCEAIYHLASSTFSSALYEVGYGHSTTVIDLAHRIANMIGVENPKFSYTERRAGDIKHSMADLNPAIGVKWDKFGLDEGLRKTIDWYKNESLLPILR